MFHLQMLIPTDLSGGKITVAGLDSQDIVSIINDSLVQLDSGNVQYFDGNSSGNSRNSNRWNRCCR